MTNLEERVARKIDPAVWALYDVAGRDGFADSKPSEAAAFANRRQATLALAREVIDMVGAEIEQHADGGPIVRPQPLERDIADLIQAELQRRVTEALRG